MARITKFKHNDTPCIVDDGKGPYPYCQLGNSHCLNARCDCTNTLYYKILYLKARNCRNPLYYLAVYLFSGWFMFNVLLAVAAWYIVGMIM